MQRQLSVSAMPKLLPEEAGGGGGGGGDDDVEAKPEKAPAPRAAGKERSVHLIPLIVVLCFLLLFLCSHDPSSTVKYMSSFGKKAGSHSTKSL